MKSLTKLLDKGKKLLENFNKEKISTDFESIFEKIIEYSKKYLEIPEIKKRFNFYVNEITQSINNEIDLFKIFLKMLKDEIIQDSLIKIFSVIINNLEEIFYKTGEFDKDFYIELKNRIDFSKEKDYDLTIKILDQYSSTKRKLIEEGIIINSILLLINFFHEKYNIDISQSKSCISILQLKMNFNELISFLKKCDERIIKIYLFDFLIKFSFLIESHIKNIMRFLLKLDNLLNRKNYNVDNYKLAKLFRILRQDPIFKDYRNAIFHSDFIIKYDDDFDKIMIIFNTDEKYIGWSIIDMFENFVKIFVLINTVQIFMASLIFEKEKIVNLVNDFFDFINREEEENLLKEVLESKECLNLYGKIINQENFKNLMRNTINKNILK